MKRSTFVLLLAAVGFLLAGCSASPTPANDVPTSTISSSQAAGTPAPPVTSAKPRASKPAALKVPNGLVGKTLREAKARLRAMGFTNIAVAGDNGGTVTDVDNVVQVPQAGRKLAPDARVRLIGQSSTSPTNNNSGENRPGDGSATDSAPGCGQRAVNAGTFNPACSEYQGYLDPGRESGRQPNSGDIQHDWGCQQGYIPKSEC